MAMVLCTGVHPGLTHTRKLILEQAGHTVITALKDSEVIEACHNFEFDVAVIGQSGPQQLKRECVGLIREHCPRAKILEVHLPNSGKAITDADDWLQSPALPKHLADHVTALAIKRRQAAS